MVNYDKKISSILTTMVVKCILYMLLNIFQYTQVRPEIVKTISAATFDATYSKTVKLRNKLKSDGKEKQNLINSLQNNLAGKITCNNSTFCHKKSTNLNFFFGKRNLVPIAIRDIPVLELDNIL